MSMGVIADDDDFWLCVCVCVEAGRRLFAFGGTVSPSYVLCVVGSHASFSPDDARTDTVCGVFATSSVESV
jgi:hypothetical protein